MEAHVTYNEVGMSAMFRVPDDDPAERRRWLYDLQQCAERVAVAARTFADEVARATYIDDLPGAEGQVEEALRAYREIAP